MGLRQWFRERMLGDEVEGGDVPPSSSIMNTLLGREEERIRSLGEYNAQNYPTDMRELLERREEVTRELLAMNLLTRQSRVEAIPALRDLLRKYPHPIAYEALIHGYLDAGRFDEAKGVAFAAKQRRVECSRSEHPEIRAETDRLREWSTEEIDELRREREGG
jgi:pentatricopeptide repeat protein